MGIKGTHTTGYVTIEEVSTLTIEEIVDYINGCKDAIREARDWADVFCRRCRSVHAKLETTNKEIDAYRALMLVMLIPKKKK